MSVYRDQEFACPACATTLRAFHDRYCCDGCGGMQLAHGDLQRSIEELANAACVLEWQGDTASRRTCPQCSAAMTHATLEIRFDDERLHTKQASDRCPEHGPWFDGDGLAQVFLLVERRINRGTAAAARPNPRDNDLSRITATDYAWRTPKKK